MKNKQKNNKNIISKRDHYFQVISHLLPNAIYEPQHSSMISLLTLPDIQAVV